MHRARCAWGGPLGRMLRTRCSVAIALGLFGMIGQWVHPQETVIIDASGTATPFPHYWEQMFGSGRAVLSLRESYRNDIRAVKQVADFRYVRFHAIFHDEVGVYNLDERGNPIYNFSYVDQIYDGLLKNDVRPFVEISFMPRRLAFNPDALHPFWYKPNVSPPRNMEAWDALIAQFIQHLVDRYGIDEVANWYFEVWNEPNIDFWVGVPSKRSYFNLYAHTARAIKGVSQRLRVGGPATAAASWITDFLRFTADNHVPVDFVSTHAYADDDVEDLFGNNVPIPMDDRVCRAVDKVRSEIKNSSTPNLPFLLTEWSVQGTDGARDTIFVGPALANTISQCDGLVNLMSFWTFSDVFEEGGPIPKPFIGSFGLRAKGGINKPSYYAFGLLHQLGDKRLANSARDAIVTVNGRGGLTIALWNLVDPGEQGSAKTINLVFEHISATSQVSIQELNADHGNVLKAYKEMGEPIDPTPDQVEKLNEQTALPAPVQTRLASAGITIHLSPNALALIKVEP
jgi:xylan 1,4-beta-xylosidase